MSKFLTLLITSILLCVSTNMVFAGWEGRSGGSIPGNAKPGGNESNGTILYICRANFNGGKHPGKVRPAFGGCNIPWGGGEHAVGSYEVLVDKQNRLRWKSAVNGNVPAGSLSAGKEANGQSLFICRANFNGGVHPGKIRKEFGGCNIPWGGGEHAIKSYEVLIFGDF